MYEFSIQSAESIGQNTVRTEVSEVLKANYHKCIECLKEGGKFEVSYEWFCKNVWKIKENMIMKNDAENKEKILECFNVKKWKALCVSGKKRHRLFDCRECLNVEEFRCCLCLFCLNV